MKWWGAKRSAAEPGGDEAAQRLAEARLRLVTSSSPVVLYTCEAAGKFTTTFVSDGIRAQLGYEPEEPLAEAEFWASHVHPDDRERVFAELAALLERGHASTEYRFRHRDGSFRWMRDDAILRRDAAGRPVEIVGAMSDVGARKEAELEYRTILQTAIDGFLITDRQGRILEVNETYCGMSGYDREALLTLRVADLEAAESPEEARRHIERIVALGSDRFESRHRRRDGSALDVEVSVRFLDQRGGIFVAFIQDISARKRIEQEHREASRSLATLVEERTASLARATAEMRESRLAALNMMQDAVDSRIQLEALNADLLHEAAERRRAEAETAVAEEQLRQGQKIEAIGRLAGGVAHDFNNILGVISGFGELALEALAPDHPAQSSLDEVLAAAKRAAGLTRQLLAFSRKQVMRPETVDLNPLTRELERMLRPLLGEDIELRLELGEGVGTVVVDPSQIQQVIMNLAINARDAMPQGGTLTIETANTEFAEDYTDTHPPAVPGRFVMLAVSDTGAGMDAETRERCFEPFFTTKPEGEGTGLGLSTVYGIVKQNGGYVWVYSEPGKGTAFKIYLPRVDLPAGPSSIVDSRPEATTGTETILVVEDTEGLRRMIRRMLEGIGYTVLVAADGEEALALAADHSGAIDLLLTDVVMPKLGGAELANHLAARRPGLRVLFMSGYTQGAIAQHGVLLEGVSLLEKPFSRTDLTRAVREALDRPATG